MSPKEHIKKSLPNIIRLDEAFDGFAKSTGFNLKGFNDAVVIRKKDMLCLLDDGLKTNSALEVMINMLSSDSESFGVITPRGVHKYHVKQLNNKRNPFGDSSKDRLVVLSRTGFTSHIYFSA
jgi:hypothetical protein